MMYVQHPKTIDIHVSNQQIAPFTVWVLEPSYVRVIPFCSPPPPTTGAKLNPKVEVIKIDNDENNTKEEPIAVPEQNIMEENNVEAEEIIFVIFL